MATLLATFTGAAAEARTIRVPDDYPTIQAAANVTQPGDEVVVAAGTYELPVDFYGVRIKRSGTPSAWITYRAEPGVKLVTAVDNNTTWFMVDILANYIIFKDFEFVGNAYKISLEEAQENYKAERAKYVATGQQPLNARFFQTCLAIHDAHHVTVQNITAHGCPGSGVLIQRSDYVTVRQSRIYDNAWWGPYDTSGIHVHDAYNFDFKTNVKINILYNYVYNNANAVPFYMNDRLTDGNGITVDENQRPGPYYGRTLIQGNVTWGNGGGGILLNKAKRVDVINNTSYMDNVCPIPGSDCGNLNYGPLFAGQSEDVHFYNNISVAAPGKPSMRVLNHAWQKVTEGNNLFWAADGKVTFQGFIPGPSNVMADPLIVKPDAADFRILRASSARGIANGNLLDGRVIMNKTRDGFTTVTGAIGSDPKR